MLTLIPTSKFNLKSKKIEQSFNKIFKRKKLEVIVSLISNKEIKKINKIYRRKNKITDVLSFCYSSSCGEIVISPKQAKREKIEIIRLIIHGLLHIIGYDHQTIKQAKIMEKREKEILSLCQ